MNNFLWDFPDDYTMTDAEAYALQGPHNRPTIKVRSCPPQPKELNKETWYFLMVDGVPMDVWARYELTTTGGLLCLWIYSGHDSDYFYFDPNRVVLMEREWPNS